MMNGIKQTELTPDAITDFRMAGEIFGRLYSQLSFGYLTMHHHNYRFVFRFGFKAKGKSFSAEWIVKPIEIRLNKQNVELLVENVVHDWKADFRRASSDVGGDL